MFKLYKSGHDFFEDNKSYLLDNILETQLIIKNTLNNNEVTTSNQYFIKVYTKDSFLLIICKKPYNLLLAGNKDLIKEGVKLLFDYNLHFPGILSTNELCNEFIKEYSALLGGTFKVKTKMQIMKHSNKIDDFTNNVTKLTLDNRKDLENIMIVFYEDALSKKLSTKELEEKAIQYIEGGVYGIFEDNKLVCIAARARTFINASSVSLVCTLREYRNIGYAKQIVKYITKEIHDENKIPTLFVDANNPISNKAYLDIGYNYFCDQVDYTYTQGNIKEAIFAGGCFWCMAKPYYEFDGVLNVSSGYACGNTICPTYEEVKTKTTGHLEVVKITYDENKISFKQLLDIYFDSIDPFDDGGQFIDRGQNYRTAILITDISQKEIIENKFIEIENIFKQKVAVQILEDAIFYKAEEHHQDYHLKNPLAYKAEYESSKREEKFKELKQKRS